METYLDFLTEATGESVRAIAGRIGVDQTTLNRQLSGSTALRMETVVAICRAYAMPFGPSIVLAGFMTPEEVAGMNPRGDLSQFTDVELAKETLRRVSEGEHVAVPVIADDFDPYMSLPRDDEGGARAVAARQAAPRRKSS